MDEGTKAKEKQDDEKEDKGHSSSDVNGLRPILVGLAACLALLPVFYRLGPGTSVLVLGLAM